MNPNLFELETLIDPDLPKEVVLRVPDEWLLGTLKSGLVYTGGGQGSVPETVTCVRVVVAGHDITLRADGDPDFDVPVIH